MLTKLEIINDTLSAVGYAAVPSLDSQHPAFLKARRALDYETKVFQSAGYWFNTYEAALEPDGNGEIILPQYTERVLNRTNRDIVQRGRKLFNLRTQTNVIDCVQHCKLTDQLPIEIVPVSAQNVIALLTRKRFLTDEGASEKLGNLNQDIQTAWVLFRAENIEQQQQNMYNGTVGGMKRPTSAGNGYRYHPIGVPE